MAPLATEPHLEGAPVEAIGQRVGGGDRHQFAVGEREFAQLGQQVEEEGRRDDQRDDRHPDGVHEQRADGLDDRDDPRVVALPRVLWWPVLFGAILLLPALAWGSTFSRRSTIMSWVAASCPEVLGVTVAQVRDGLWLIVWGFFQKIFVADNLTTHTSATLVVLATASTTFSMHRRSGNDAPAAERPSESPIRRSAATSRCSAEARRTADTSGRCDFVADK